LEQRLHDIEEVHQNVLQLMDTLWEHLKSSGLPPGDDIIIIRVLMEVKCQAC
jgi:hypothetical protein